MPCVYMFLTGCRVNPGLLTKKFIDLIKQADDGVLDLNKAADTLHVSILPGPSHFRAVIGRQFFCSTVNFDYCQLIEQV